MKHLVKDSGGGFMVAHTPCEPRKVRTYEIFGQGFRVYCRTVNLLGEADLLELCIDRDAGYPIPALLLAVEHALKDQLQ